MSSFCSPISCQSNHLKEIAYNMRGNSNIVAFKDEVTSQFVWALKVSLWTFRSDCSFFSQVMYSNGSVTSPVHSVLNPRLTIDQYNLFYFWQMEQMCDPGCGQDVVNFREGRDYIRSIMMQEDPRRNGQDITEIIRRNRQMSDEAKMRARMQKRKREAAGKGQDSSSNSDSESFSKCLAQQFLPDSIGEMGPRGVSGEVIRLNASTFHDNIMRHGVDHLHVILLDDEGREDCAIIGSIFSQLAHSLPSRRIRFFRMQYHQALPDLDRATELPTILFYCGGDILFQTKGLSDLGGVSKGLEGHVITHLGRDEFRMRLMKSISAVLQDVSIKQACLQKASRDRNSAAGFGTISSDSESGSA